MASFAYDIVMTVVKRRGIFWSLLVAPRWVSRIIGGESAMGE